MVIPPVPVEAAFKLQKPIALDDDDDVFIKHPGLPYRYAMRLQPTELDNKEGYVILDLLQYVLKHEPAERPCAVDILNHPCFKEVLL